MPSLETPLAEVLKTTQFHLRRLKEIGIDTVEDFLQYFPRRYTDGRDIKRIADISLDEKCTIRGRIVSISSKSIWARRMTITTALVNDESGSIEVIWFNQAYLGKMLLKGMEAMLCGKIKHDKKKNRLIMNSPEIELIKSEQIHTARIVPVYHETELSETSRSGRARGKLSSKWIREKLHPLLPFAETFPEYLPKEICSLHGLISYSDAIKNAHFPATEKALEQAKKRLAFDELFLLQLAALYRRHMWRKIAEQEKKQIAPDWDLIKRFTASLPWQLTNVQKKAVYEIIKDLEKPYPMSRLLEGDTGSGKTVVAAAAALHVIVSGWQCCVLAPTEILANQHAKTFEKVLKPFGISPILLTGSTPAAQKKEITRALKEGEIKLVIGTHALIQEKIGFKALGLTIVDEQHRFGVKQREIPKTHGSPHILSLTATPIPRTLALVFYGDQDLSVLDEMPPGRQKIITRIVPEEKRSDSYKWIEKEIKKGRQAFIIFPLIDESPNLEIKAATQEWQELSQNVFPNLKVSLLHGQMQPEDKKRIMKNFADGKSDILVSTSVIEVGVDVPAATIMVIEGAERFGLAQLHQFRGRVGRGTVQSYCLLFPTALNPLTYKRLNALVKNSSGFKLAEIDLELRGPGEVYGTAQSGIPDLKMASLSDIKTIKEAREAAELIINEDAELNAHKELKQKILEQQNIAIDY